MARKKGNQQKKGVPVSGSAALPNGKERATASEINVLYEEELEKVHPSVTLEENINVKFHTEVETKRKYRYGKSPRSEKQAVDTAQVDEKTVTNGGDSYRNLSTEEASESVQGNMSSSSRENTAGNLDFSDTMVFRNLRSLALSIMKASTNWQDRHRPFFVTARGTLLNACRYVRMKIELAYPVILKWVVHFVSILVLLGMMWLDCTLRGIDSLLRMGTTSFFSVLWCGVFSVIAMVGFFKFLLVLAVAVVVGLFIGLTAAVILTGISGVVLLWFYGSFWTTMLIVFLGGFTFTLGCERLALFISSMYSVYCAWSYVGWLGLIFALNLSFISSKVLLIFLSDKINEQRNNGAAGQTAGVHGQSSPFYGEPMNAEAAFTGVPADRDPGIPSTSESESESESTPESEIVRLLNCRDHYSALGFSRFENVDLSILKREYRKKAMLVHPDKNMGNEKAVEAFKKLQNAYEVLLDSYKRKTYDDELRSEELLNYFRQLQETSQKSRWHGLFSSVFGLGEADSEDILGESRRIACRKCGNFHLWTTNKKLKSKARWCQECSDFHSAKDGDGWVEQSSHPLFFGVLQKVNPPAAYVCADSKIYNATEWYICQGMRCTANTHKPSFHVNTSVTSKQTGGWGASSGHRGGGIPTPNMEENMTEEEFFEWLQNAVQAGAFNNLSGSPSESQPPAAGSGSTSKSGGGSSNSKKKKRGKK